MKSPADRFAALGHVSRLAIFRLLARRAPEGVPANEIAEALGVRPNTLSAHLAVLAKAGLIGGRRGGRTIRYALDLAATGAMIDYLVSDCCRGRPELCAPVAARSLARRMGGADMKAARDYAVLFVCTGNSARSIFAEAIMNAEGRGRFRAYSAGTRPAPAPNPLAISRLRELGHDVSGLRSKSVAEFQKPDAPRLDFVFTVCDAAANEECPVWPGQPVTGHWGVPDPAKAAGSDAEKAVAFAEAYRMLKHRISAFVSLPVERLDAIAIQREVDRIGRAEVETAPAERGAAS